MEDSFPMQMNATSISEPILYAGKGLLYLFIDYISIFLWLILNFFELFVFKAPPLIEFEKPSWQDAKPLNIINKNISELNSLKYRKSLYFNLHFNRIFIFLYKKIFFQLNINSTFRKF